MACSLTIPRWDREPRDEVILSPSWNQVRSAVRGLNGESLNDLYLMPDDQAPDRYFAVAGGPGLYVVFICEANERFIEAVSSHVDDGTRVSLTCGGQVGSFAARQLVDLDTALTAAKHFYDTSSASPHVTWVTR